MFLGALFGVCAALAGAHSPRRRSDLRQYVAADGKLQAPLVYRDAQDGFAGVSGEVWTIEAGGHFSIARFLNEKANAPYWERDLTLDELRALAKMLATNHLLMLPNRLGRDELGREEKVNPHVLTLAFGTMKSELVLQAGESGEGEQPSENDPKAAAWRDFIGVVRALRVLAKDRPQAGPGGAVK